MSQISKTYWHKLPSIIFEKQHAATRYALAEFSKPVMKLSRRPCQIHTLIYTCTIYNKASYIQTIPVEFNTIG